MTPAEMIDRIQYRLDTDPAAPVRYTETVVLAALNTKQDELAAMAHPALLKSLQARQDIVVQATGYALNGLSRTYFRYVNSQLYGLSNGGWITKIDGENLGIQDNQWSKGSDVDPMCYIWNSVYYLLVTTYSGSYNAVRLYYVAKPTALTDSSSDTCELHPLLHPILMDAAEALLRATYKHGGLDQAIALGDKAAEKLLRYNGEIKRGELLV